MEHGIRRVLLELSKDGHPVSGAGVLGNSVPGTRAQVLGDWLESVRVGSESRRVKHQMVGIACGYDFCLCMSCMRKRSNNNQLYTLCPVILIHIK